MSRSWLAGGLVVALLAGTLAAQADVIWVPMSLADKVATVECTELDIGEPKHAVDGDAKTLCRTPSINPMEVRVAFTEPVTLEHLRLRLIDTRHQWTLAVADSMEDLKAERGSYRVLREDEVTLGDRVDVHLDEPVTVGALELHILRQGGDDYVHLWEIQFCEPGRIDGMRIERVKERRQAVGEEGRVVVEGPVEKPVDTVVWFKAKAIVKGEEADVDADVQWQSHSPGLVPFNDQPGFFHVTAVGEHKLTITQGDFTQTITVIGTPRELSNRKPDIEVLFIQRLPEIPYDGPNGGLPEVGAEIVWRAHVYNWGTAPVPATYEWTLDGEVVGTGELVVPVGPPHEEVAFIDLPAQYRDRREMLTLTVTPQDALDELITKNNSLTIATDAIMVGLWVERSLWDYHHEHQHKLPTKDANSFAGWGQRMMGQWNKMFREARYREFPDGVQERVRLQKVVVVPDFALPLNGGLPSNNPDTRDKSVDMMWGCEAGDLVPGIELDANHWWSVDKALNAFEKGLIEQEKQDPPFWCGLGYIHEMAHARYLVDAYGFNVHTGTGDKLEERLLKVTDEGGPVLGRHMPMDQDIQHWRKYVGQMGGDYWKWSVFEAMCWDRVRGQRARGGACNSPPTIGEFLQDIPDKCIYQFVDTERRPLAGAEVLVYRSQPLGKHWYTKVYEDKPELRFTADAEGRIEADRHLWSEDGRIRHTFGHSNGVALLRVIHEGRSYFLFEEVTDANLAYNLGHTDEYTFIRMIELRDGEPDPAKWDVNARWEPPGVGFGRPVDGVAAE